MTPGAVKLRESLQLSWRVYLTTKLNWSLSMFDGEFKQVHLVESHQRKLYRLGVFHLLPRHITETTGAVFEAELGASTQTARMVLESRNGHQFVLQHRGDPSSDAIVALFSTQDITPSQIELETFFAATKIQRESYYSKK